MVTFQCWDNRFPLSYHPWHVNSSCAHMANLLLLDMLRDYWVISMTLSIDNSTYSPFFMAVGQSLFSCTKFVMRRWDCMDDAFVLEDMVRRWSRYVMAGTIVCAP